VAYDGEINVNTEIDSSAFSKLGSIASKGFKALTIAIGAVSAGIADLGTAAVKYKANMEQYTTSFAVMTGSAEKPVDIKSRLKEIGASTPFETETIAETTQLLMNYGFTADDAIDKMQMLGDISQGSAEKMKRNATAYVRCRLPVKFTRRRQTND
jgi:hypothetical protein